MTAHKNPAIKLSLWPISTPINLLITGAIGSGKTTFIKTLTQKLCAASEATDGVHNASRASFLKSSVSLTGSGGTSNSSEPHMLLKDNPAALCTSLKPITVPEACRKLLYTLQVLLMVNQHVVATVI